MGLPRFPAAGLLLAAVTASAPGSPVPAQVVPDDFTITLQRTACFGECPVYTVSIDATGHVTYEGKAFVRVTGRQTDRIPVDRVAALLAMTERIGFFALRDRYRTIRNPDGSETMVTDLPTTFVTVRRDGRSKRVEDYLGAPPGLKELARRIDEAARTVRWIRIDEPTLRRMVSEGRSPSAAERATLLRQALLHDEVEVVKALVEIGADPDGEAGAGTIPLMLVRSPAAARALLEAGADPAAASKHAGTPLHFAAAYLPPEITQVLLEAGAPADQRLPADGQTPLWAAACAGNARAVELLLKAGADPTARAAGISPLECARRASQTAQPRNRVLDNDPPFDKDFDRVIARLEEALVKHKDQ